MGNAMILRSGEAMTRINIETLNEDELLALKARVDRQLEQL